jgi:hypothetical protein
MPKSLTPVAVRSRSRAVAAAILLGAFGIASGSLLVALFLVYTNPRQIADRDFVAYWATGRQLTSFRNPYDLVALSKIEHAVGLEGKYSVAAMRNPPWALPLTLPFGFLSLRASGVLALLVLAASYAASVRILLGIWRGRDRIAQAVLYLFAPALICLIWGQTSVLVLLGLALFLRFHETRPLLAGASLWLCTLKPHLLIPAAVVLATWILVTRSYRVLAGLAAALLASIAVTLIIDVQAFTEYAHMIGSSGYEQEAIPTLSALLRTWFMPNLIPLQFAPAAAACVWAFAYFWSRRRDWVWHVHGILLLPVSLVVAPYAFLNDHVVVLPALALAACRTRRQWPTLTVALASTCLVMAFVVRWSPAPLYWATCLGTLVWLAWYLFTTKDEDSRVGG